MDVFELNATQAEADDSAAMMIPVTLKPASLDYLLHSIREQTTLEARARAPGCPVLWYLEQLWVCCLLIFENKGLKISIGVCAVWKMAGLMRAPHDVTGPADDSN